MTELATVLFLDDEPRLLDGIRRQLHRVFEVTTTTDPNEALALLTSAPPMVVVSDYAMPGMNGAAFLARACELAPDTTRVLLTGQADLQGATAAVNEGRIFRFLLKPTSTEDLTAALEAAVKQHRLVTSEKVLLEQTLRGSVQALVETLSIANPPAFARCTRVHQVVVNLLDALGETDRWSIEMAALLSQIGAVTLPPSVAEKLSVGAPLEPHEASMVAKVPIATEQILASIPRLEDVRAVLAHEGDGGPLGARLLRLALDYDVLECSGLPLADVLNALHLRDGCYDQALLRLLGEVVASSAADELIEVTLDELQPGMVFADDVRTSDGVLLVSRGHAVTPSVLTRIRNFSAVSAGLPATMLVIAPRHARVATAVPS